MRYFLYSLIIFLSVNSFSQSEQEIATKTLKVYQEKKYEEAKSNYIKLLSLQPRNADYNFYYGVCLLKTTASKAEAIKHLEYAVNSNIENPEVYYYLGLAYHLNYQFKKAILNYQLYIENKDVKDKNTELDAARQIEMCQNGLKLFQKLSDITVLDKKEYAADEFYRIYDYKSLNGTILISKLDQSKVDKKYDHFPVIFYPNNSEIIFFSSYGDKDKGDKDIYFKMKTGDGWSIPQLVQGDINTDFDEAFPYFDSQTNTLYFSSKGHNSMGGYDVFSAKYNPSTKSFSDVKNIDFAISSTSDDLFYIPDEKQGIAWFASDRESKPGILTIYKVEIERYPSTLALINGTFETKDKSKGIQIKIDLYTKKDNRKIGSYFTDDNGKYDIPVYFSGDYEYRVTIPGSNKTYPLNFTIPKVSNLTQYGQKIIYKKIDEKEYVELLVLSEQELGKDDDKILEIIREKSELKVNDIEMIKENKSIKEYTLLEDKLQLGKESLEKSIEFESKTNQKLHDNVRVILVLQDELKIFVAKEDINKLSPIELKDAKEKLERINYLELENNRLKKLSDSLAIENNSVSKNLVILNDLSDKLSAIPDSSKSDLTVFKKENSVGLNLLLSITTENKTSLFDDYDVKNEKLKEQLDELKEQENKLLESENQLTALKTNLTVAKEKEKPILEENIKSQEQKIEQQKQDINYLNKKIEIARIEVETLNERKEFLTAIYQKNVEKVFTNQDISNELEKLENKNFKPIKNLLEQSYSRLVKIENETQLNPSDIQSKELSQHWQNYKELENKNEITPSNTQLAIYQQLENALEEEILTIKAKPNTTENQQYVKKLEAALQEVSEKKNAVVAENDDEEKIAKNSLIDQLYPDYNQVIDKINETEYNNDWDKVIALKQQEKLLLERATSNQTDGKNEELSQLKKSVEISISQLQERLQYVTDKEAASYKGTSISLQKAINNLDFNSDKEAFTGQINDLQEVIQKDIDEAIELKRKMSKENVNTASIDEAISALEETLAVVEAKQSEYDQLKELNSNNTIAQNNKENQENNTVVENNQTKNNNENNVSQNNQNSTQNKNNQGNVTNQNNKENQGNNTVVENNQSKNNNENNVSQNKENSTQNNNQGNVTNQNNNNENQGNNTVVENKQSKNNNENSTQNKNNQGNVTNQNNNENQGNNTVVENNQTKNNNENNVSQNNQNANQNNNNQGKVTNQNNNENQGNNTVVENNQSKNNNENNASQNNQNSTQNNNNQGNVTNQNNNNENQVNNTVVENNQTKNNNENNVSQNNQNATQNNNNQGNITNQNTNNENQGKNTVVENNQTKNNNENNVSQNNQSTNNDVTKYPVTNQEVVKNVNQNANLLEKVDGFEKAIAIEHFDNSSNFTNDISNENVALETVESNVKTLDFTDADTKEFIHNAVNQLQTLSQSDNSLVKNIADNQVQFIQREIAHQTVQNNLSSTVDDEVELPAKYYENRLNQLYNEQQKTASSKDILAQTGDKLNKKEKEEQTKLLKLLTSKEVYLQKQIAATQEEIANQQQSRAVLDDLQEEYIELESIIIRMSKANAEQLTLYEVLHQELISLEKLYVQKDILENQLVIALNESDDEQITKITNLIRQNKQLRTELEQLTTSNMRLLKSEIETPTKTLTAIPSSVELQKEVSEVAFAVHPQETITSDQIKTILDSDNYPKGLFFRVQVGAFAKPINENVYRDFSPISMENLNKGLIKYMAGYFTVENVAATARDQIRQLGFKDAFIVAYCDGKRIPVFEARRLLAEGICLPVTTKDLLFHIDSTKQQLLAKVEEREAITTNNSIITPVQQATTPIMKNNTLDATSVKDLYFTVQIGVFNRYVEDELLKGLNPINTDELNPKTIRYSVGVFDELNKAKEQRLEAIQKGFTDAFVVAYYQGKRITVQAANALLAAGTAQVVKLNTNTQEIAVENNVIQQEVNYIDQLKKTVAENKVATTNSKIIVNEDDVTNPTSDIQFTVSSTSLNLVFYWWIIHNFENYTLQKVDNSIVVHGYCDKSDKEDILVDFQALQFLNVNIVK